MICKVCDKQTKGEAAYHPACAKQVEQLITELNLEARTNFRYPAEFTTFITWLSNHPQTELIFSLPLGEILLPTWADFYWQNFSFALSNPEDEHSTPTLNIKDQDQFLILLAWAKKYKIDAPMLKKWLPGHEMTKLLEETDRLLSGLLVQCLEKKAEISEFETNLENAALKLLLPEAEYSKQFALTVERVEEWAKQQPDHEYLADRLKLVATHLELAFSSFNQSTEPEVITDFAKQFVGSINPSQDAEDQGDEAPTAEESETKSPPDADTLSEDEVKPEKPTGPNPWDDWDEPFDLRPGEYPVYQSDVVLINTKHLFVSFSEADLSKPLAQVREGLEELMETDIFGDVFEDIFEDDDLIEEGTVYLTNQRVVFEDGDLLDLGFDQVLVIKPLLEGLGFKSSAGEAPWDWRICCDTKALGDQFFLEFQQIWESRGQQQESQAQKAAESPDPERATEEPEEATANPTDPEPTTEEVLSAEQELKLQKTVIEGIKAGEFFDPLELHKKPPEGITWDKSEVPLWSTEAWFTTWQPKETSEYVGWKSYANIDLTLNPSADTLEKGTLILTSQRILFDGEIETQSWGLKEFQEAVIIRNTLIFSSSTTELRPLFITKHKLFIERLFKVLGALPQGRSSMERAFFKQRAAEEAAQSTTSEKSQDPPPAKTSPTVPPPKPPTDQVTVFLWSFWVVVSGLASAFGGFVAVLAFIVPNNSGSNSGPIFFGLIEVGFAWFFLWTLSKRKQARSEVKQRSL